jgi:hypothetical protein
VRQPGFPFRDGRGKRGLRDALAAQAAELACLAGEAARALGCGESGLLNPPWLRLPTISMAAPSAASSGTVEASPSRACCWRLVAGGRSLWRRGFFVSWPGFQPGAMAAHP